MKISKKEAYLCLIALDELIKKWENFGIEISDEWYTLREKLMKMVK